MKFLQKNLLGIFLTIFLAALSYFIGNFIPGNIISSSVIALLIGMMLNPLLMKYSFFTDGVSYVSKKVLRFSIVLMGITLNFSQVLSVGKFSLIVMCFTLLTAFGGGYLLGKLLKMNWKLAALISAGTGICGGSAIAAVSPVIDADDSDVAYSISAIFLFDIIMVILFPLAGHAFGMSNLGYGLWTGTAVNDTSAVVAAGYAFSDIAGNFSIIVKMTRTLAIIPVVLIFSMIQQRSLRNSEKTDSIIKNNRKIDWVHIFPWFVLLFLCVIGIKSTGLVPQSVCSSIASLSKFFMVMALGAIGLKTNFHKVIKSGIKPMLHGIIVSFLVIGVSFLVQLALGQL